MGVDLTWKGADLHAVVVDWMSQNGEAMANTIADEIIRLLGSPYPPASRPGQSPRRRTGQLQDSIQVEEVRLAMGLAWHIIQDAADAEYGKYLELGTRKMAPRPFFRRGIRSALRKLRSVLKPMRGGAAPRLSAAGIQTQVRNIRIVRR